MKTSGSGRGVIGIRGPLAVRPDGENFLQKRGTSPLQDLDLDRNIIGLRPLQPLDPLADRTVITAKLFEPGVRLAGRLAGASPLGMTPRGRHFGIRNATPFVDVLYTTTMAVLAIFRLDPG